MAVDRLKTLLELLDEKPNDSFLLFAVAKEYENQDNLNQALSYYLKLKEADHKYLGLYYHLAKLYESIQEDILAMKTYGEGIVLAKEIGDFHSLSELNNAKMNLELQLGN